jgi:hypothetical protein
MTAHVAERAGFLAALAADDPERKLAEEHARSCGPCREALDEGQRLVALLAEARPLDQPSPELVQRAAAAIERETAAERRPWRILRWGAAGTVLLAWLLQVAYGKSPARDGRSMMVSLAVLAVAVVGVALLNIRRRFAAVAVVVALVVASGGFALAAGIGNVGWMPDFQARFGVECTACELVAAVLPWLAVVLLARFQHIRLDRGVTMIAAAAGALASQAAQFLTCPVRFANPHLLVFHFGGFLLALGLGALDLVPAPRAAP